MNLYKCFTDKEIELLNKAGVTIEDKEYAKEEPYHYAIQIGDYIMRQSSKNGVIAKTA